LHYIDAATNGYWQDSEILFQHALAVTKNNHIAHNNYGAVLEEKGQLDDAISQFEEAIRLRSDDAPAHYNLGNAFARKNLFDEAINQYQEVIRLEPDDVQHINLGNVFYQKASWIRPSISIGKPFAWNRTTPPPTITLADSRQNGSN